MGSAASYRFVASASVGAINISNFSITQIGEIAAYTPQSIGTTNGSWADVTSNNNHGTITGATNVNETIFGALKIKGAASNNKLQIFGTESANERLELYHDGSSANIISTAGTGTHYTLNQFARQFYFYTWRDSAWTNSIHIATDGSVKATSAASDNLIQVARVSNIHSITVGTNAAANGSTKTIWNIAHNLGTNNVVVSVREGSASLGSRTHVETQVHAGEYYSGSSSAWQADTNYVAIEFASSPADGTVFNITVIG